VNVVPKAEWPQYLNRVSRGLTGLRAEIEVASLELGDQIEAQYLPVTGVFPDNLEFETRQTFTADDPGSEVNGIAPDGRAVTFGVHHSFIRLPAPGFVPRPQDPRTGTSAQVLFADYATRLDQPIVQRLARRFRLEKTDPTAVRSRVKKPIVYYVDRGAPEPIRTALIEGGQWWAKAFEEAGYIDAFRVESLPEGVDPMDARYNVVNWIHRQTRGWSTGTTVVDPRTGEIVRGVVQLGSLRVRQDRLIFEGLVGADKTGKGGPDDPLNVSLARIRQLSVHEIGHTLGLAHNFAGSTYDRASVMDYPAPLVRIEGDRLDLSDAYAKGVGAWDRFAINWLYSQGAPGSDEAARLDRLARDAQANGLRFVTDGDSRSAAAGQPYGALWDNGPDAVAELEHVLAVRKIALSKFGLVNLPSGAPAADLKRVLAPIYLFHRYQVDATAKLVGGVDFTYAAEGDGREASKIVPPARQAAAIDALLRTLAPVALDLSDKTLDVLTSGQSQGADKANDVETFGQGPVFDLPATADVAADLVWGDLFAPARLNRLMEAKRRDPAQPGVEGLLDKALAFAAFDGKATGRQAELARRVRQRMVVNLANALGDKDLSPTAAAVIRARLADWGKGLKAVTASDAADRAQARALAGVVTDESGDRLAGLIEEGKAKIVIPPGPPIGEDDWFGGIGL